MTEYNQAYNWEKTWLNGAPNKRASKTPCLLEPQFQRKRYFEPSDSYNFCRPESQSQEIAEDPFFIIYGRSRSEIAYPNILFRRSKSAPRQKQIPSPSPPNNPRPKSVTLREIEKPDKKQKKKHHLKTRDRSKEKTAIERWPELKMTIPTDSPQEKSAKKSEYQRSFSPPPAYIYNQNRPQTTKNLSDTKRQKRYTEAFSKNKQVNSELKIKSNVMPSIVPSKELIHSPKNSQCDSKPETRQRRFQSEYRANYKDLSTYTSVAKRHSDEAKQNQQQMEECHFSREHFNQLESATVNMWDPPSSSRSEIVGLDPALRAKRLEEYNQPYTRRPVSSLLNSAPKFPRQSFRLPIRSSLPSSISRYEPSKYLHQATNADVPRIKVLPFEELDDLGCIPERHLCSRGRNLLVSRTRPEEISLSGPLALPRLHQSTRCPSPAHLDRPLSPSVRISPIFGSTNLDLAKYTLDRALPRHNKLLISACRN